MDRRALFLRTVDDLARKAASNDPYEILLSAALVRKLFVDGTRLVDRVHRDLKEKVAIRFRIMPWTDIPGVPLDTRVQPDLLDPSVLPDSPNRVDVKRDAFLAATVGVVKGKRLTVRDVVLCATNILGAVHLDDPEQAKADEQRLLAKMNEQLLVGGVPMVIRILRAIARNCVLAVEPLVLACGGTPWRPGANLKTAVQPAAAFDWSHGLGIFCVLRARAVPRHGALLVYGRPQGPRAETVVGPQGITFRIVDADGRVHDESVEAGKLIANTPVFLRYQLERATAGWSAATFLNERAHTKSTFEARLDLATDDNQSRAHGYEGAELLLLELGKFQGTRSADDLRHLFDWARQTHGVA